MNSAAFLPDNNQAISTSVAASLGIDSKFTPGWCQLRVRLFKPQESLTGRRLLVNQVHNITHRPFLGGLVNPDAISKTHPDALYIVADNPLSPNVLLWLMFCTSCTLDIMEDSCAQFVVMVMDRLQKTEELNSKLLQQVQQLKSVAVGLLGNPFF